MRLTKFLLKYLALAFGSDFEYSFAFFSVVQRNLIRPERHSLTRCDDLVSELKTL